MGTMPTFYDLEANTWNGNNFKFSSLKGKPCLIVNIASKCSFRGPTFEKLNSVINENINILLFPCNQYLNQEPLSMEEIHEYVSKYSDKYILFDKVNVYGKNKHAVYGYLTENSPSSLFGKSVKWNYTVFLIDGEGKLAQRYSPGENFLEDKTFKEVLQKFNGKDENL